MKVLTQIVTVFIAISLISANTTLAQDPTEETLRKVQEALEKKEQELAKNQANLLVRAQQLSQTGAADTALQAEMFAHDLETASVNLALAQAKDGTGRVLVVLTDPVKAQDVAATTEDLNIMSRIFDKKLRSAYPPLGGIYTSHRIEGLLHTLHRRNGSHGTQTIYLHGYGALFLLNVDFPLSAPPEVDVEKVEKDVDPLWEGTKREISTSDKTLAEDYVYVKYDSTKEYDAEKVEDLKTNLTKALRHAANIRNLKPDELIILTVAGTQQPSAAVAEIAGKDGKTYRVIASNADTGPLFGAAPALLTIRAKKADIDAYAKGQLDLDKFRERVKFLTSHVNLGPVRAEPAGQLQWRARY